MLNDISELTIQKFSETHNVLYRTLLNSLNTNDNWRLLLSTLRTFVTDGQIRNMELSNNPSSILLHELEIRLARVKDLKKILERSNLLDCLAVISDPEPLRIVQQPGEENNCISLEEGSTLRLECKVEGLPPPLYQWYCDNLSILGQTKPLLIVPDFTEDKCGEYYCIAHHVVNGEMKEIVTNRIIAELTLIAPQFVNDLPRVIIANVGDTVTLHVDVKARPEPQYLWLLENTVIKDQTTSTLQLDNISESAQGQYRCLVNNKAGEICTKSCDVIVNNFPTNAYENIASSKIALLIANSTYENLDDLRTPNNDVALVGSILQKLDFRIIILQNLTLVEMKNAIKWFCQILPDNAYALFYFVGHGFQLNRRYMMPVDCPKYEVYEVADCFSDDMLIKMVMDTKAQLLVTILDMCLRVPLREELSSTEPIVHYDRKRGLNLIQNFSTSSHMDAYERTTEDYGIYVKHLRKFLIRDLPVTSVLQLVIEAFDREGCNQIPSLTNDDPCRRKLTDPFTGNEELDEEISALYKLPKEEYLHFPIVNVHVTIKLSFYKGCFLNTLVIVFPTALNKWDISAEVNFEGLNKYYWGENSRGEKILILFDLQKAKSSIYLTVQLNHKSDNNSHEMVDYCLLDLSCVQIVEKRLWFDENGSS